MNKTYLKGLVEKVEEDGVLSVAVATDASEDRDGEIVNPQGIDLNAFQRNPVLLWAHDYRVPPIGKVLEIVKQDNRILFRPKFAIDISDHAKQIFALFKEGYLNAFSIGFMPKERQGNIYTKSELLEISAVPVPANSNALVLARSAGFDAGLIDEIEKTQKQMEEEVAKSLKIEKLECEVAELKQKFDEIVKSVAPSNAPDGTTGEPVESPKDDAVAKSKRILQVINRATADALRDLRNLKKQ